MRINKFSFKNNIKNWELMPVEFSDLTLLVGVSGVGKSKILKAISSVSAVASGKNRPGLSWSIEFQDEESRPCKWVGEFEMPLNQDPWDAFEIEEIFQTSEDHEEKFSKISMESLTIDGNVVLTRDSDSMLFQGKEMPKLSQHESAIHILREEDLISSIRKSFERLVFNDQTEPSGFSRMFAAADTERLCRKYKDIDAVKQASIRPLAKLFLSERMQDSTFKEVEESFKNVFPNVEEIKISVLSESEKSPYFRDMAFVQIKEQGVEKLINQSDMSSGMLRTLSHLAEIFLSPPGTVVLVDEFENSLGVNCIDAVTDDILSASSSIQFIITSHHPYIINTVSPSYWKVVGRRGSKVAVKNASDLGVGLSSHDSFLQLINSPGYMEGFFQDEALSFT